MRKHPSGWWEETLNPKSSLSSQVVHVMRKHPSGWWEGRVADGTCGWFPSTFVRELGSSPVVEAVVGGVAMGGAGEAAAVHAGA
jgi:hypothetical protein